MIISGKSLILALLSACLKLIGYDIEIVCYSSYLSNRDEIEFENFYENLQFEKNPTYTTFTQLADNIFNTSNVGKHIDFRKAVKTYLFSTDAGTLTKNSNNSSNNIDDSPERIYLAENKILLIDEVDVFFSENIFGQIQCPCISICSVIIADAQEKIWELINSKIKSDIIYAIIKKFIETQVKNDIDDYFATFYNNTSLHQIYNEKPLTNKEIIDNAIKEMIRTANHVKHLPDNYLEDFRLNCDNEIEQKDVFGIFLQSYRSNKTIFTYFRFIKENFDHGKFRNYGYITLPAGCFSYSKLPTHYPLVLGVSGTLTTLNKFETDIIQNTYNIKKLTLMPSFFGHRNIRFDTINDFKIEMNEVKWMQSIYNSSYNKIQCDGSVLIFFDTEKNLNKFYVQYKNNIDKLSKVSVDDTLKEHYVNEAGVKRTITLATRLMGRGTDFKSSVTVEKNGGIHVIQTFFSLDKKEETQIRGRTARKDNKGSYEIIINRNDLNILQMGSAENYDQLNGLRELALEKTFEERWNNVKKSEEAHQKSLNYLQRFAN